MVSQGGQPTVKASGSSFFSGPVSRSPLNVTEVPSGCRLALRVRAGARQERIIGPHGGALKVSVNAPPQRGQANRAVLDLISGALGLPAGRVEIVKGVASPDKIVQIKGLTASELLKRLLAKG